MLITLSKDNLTAAINAVQKAINPRSIMPVYSHIKLDVKGNTAVFTGAGLDIGICCSVPVQTEREGSALIPSKNFIDMVRRLPDLPLTLDVSENMDMTLRYENSFFSFHTKEVDDYPSLPSFHEGLDCTVPSDTLARLIRQSTFAASSDELKAVFTGILWEIDGSEISLVGTDTHRLAWSKAALATNTQEAAAQETDPPEEDTQEAVSPVTKASFIIPARVVTEIGRLLQDEACRVQVEKNTVFFSFGNISMSCRVMQGLFPDYKSVIPSAYATTFQAASRQFREIAERISLFAAGGDNSNTVYLEISQGELAIYSQADFGFGREEMSVHQTGGDLKIAFNARYITDFFKASDGETVDVRLSGPGSAGIMKDPEQEDFLYLILPIRV